MARRRQQREQRMLFCSWWTSVFEGRAQGCYGKGIVELFNFKSDVAKHILQWAAVNMSRTSQMCVQKMIILTTGDDLSLPRCNRTHYKGATFYNFQVGPVVMDPWEDKSYWIATRKEKKQFWATLRVMTSPHILDLSQWLPWPRD